VVIALMMFKRFMWEVAARESYWGTSMHPSRRHHHPTHMPGEGSSGTPLITTTADHPHITIVGLALLPSLLEIDQVVYLL
jgi:hypothetical protein